MLAPERRSCVAPTEVQLAELASVFKDGVVVDGRGAHRTGPSLRVASIGCGEGFLEGLLETMHGIDIVGVDLDTRRDPLGYLDDRCFLRKGRRLLSSSGKGGIYDIPEEERASTALLFCFGRRVPLGEYVAAYPTVPCFVIIGDDAAGPAGGSENDAVTQPGALDLVGQPEFVVARRLEVASTLGPRTAAVVYRRV